MTSTSQSSTTATISALVANVGLLLVAVGTLLPLLGTPLLQSRWVYAVGAALALAGRIINPYSGSNMRVRRLYRLLMWSGIFFCVAAFFMFWPGAGPTDWLAFTMAGAAVVIYSSLMLPRALKNDK